MAATKARRREGNMCRWEEASFILEKEERHISGDALRSSGRVLYLVTLTCGCRHVGIGLIDHTVDCLRPPVTQAAVHVNQRLEMIL
jgi:hypothetical protein